MFKRFARSLRVINQLRTHEVKTSYSQEGEDRVLSRYFGSKKVGFYVDVGAYHPYINSNTALFYERGWSGVNVDCHARFSGWFSERRRRDRNINCAVGGKAEQADYYVVGSGLAATMNTLNRERAESIGQGPLKVENVSVVTLASIMEEQVGAWQTIDFMNVDVEGMDLEVLQSNDFSRFRPRVILVETGAQQGLRTSIQEFMGKNGYEAFARTGLTEFFEDSRSL